MNAIEKICPQCSVPFVSGNKCDTFCALSGTCGMIRCPGCGHEFPDLERSFMARLLTKWLKRPCEPLRPEKGALRSVNDLRTGEIGTIAEVRADVIERASELLIFGIAPGAKITVVQRKPEIVVRIGETTLAIEHDVASDILVFSVD